MDEDNSPVIVLAVRKCSRSLNEVGNIEGHKDTTLAGRFLQQIGIVECFQCGITRCSDRIVPKLSEGVAHGRRDVCVKENTTRHL